MATIFSRVLLAATLLVLLAGCGAGARPEPPSPPAGTPIPLPAAIPRPAAPGGIAVERSDSWNFATLTSATADRLIVRTVAMSLLVEDISKALETIASLATGAGGFVVSSRVSGEEEGRSGLISIRVPAEQTDAVLGRVRGLAVRVPSEQSSAQDVTEEYVDVQARTRNLERTEEQYLRLLDRAETVEDALKVQRELSNVQGQIEQAKGRMQYLERTSASSLITVELQPAGSPRRLVEPGWSPWETAKSAVRALARFGQGLANGAILLGVWALVWVPLAAVGWFVGRWAYGRWRAAR
ncbi:MAG: DUF4349 domain-containing protein [Chloroflexi bacterium]|nr:DUF4349 domain-containing protein [Chloroflexota bacterium]